MNQLPGMPLAPIRGPGADCPNLGGNGWPLVQSVYGACLFRRGHAGDCNPLGGHNPPTFKERLDKNWAAGWRPEHEHADDAHEDWLGDRGQGSTWLIHEDEMREAEAHYEESEPERKARD